MYGVRSAAPIVLPPQACALGLGAITDTVVPRVGAKDGEDNWEVRCCMCIGGTASAFASIVK